MRKWRLVVSCEHGGNRVPAGCAALFAGREEWLASHWGYDLGALSLARIMARRLHAPLIFSTTTRLAVELNRSLHHRALFSEATRELIAAQKQALLDRCYHPHRRAVKETITRFIQRGGNVFHVAVHSFTPELNGQMRNADIGLLYNPSRRWERFFCHAWRTTLSERAPDLRVRMNYPYLGTADGLITALRRKFSANRYAGIELEVNQKWVRRNRFPSRIVNALVTAVPPL